MDGLELGSKVRRAYRALLRRRSYHLRIKVIDASTDIDRQELLAPSPGRRLRFVRVKVLQESSDGRHLWELFFGDAGNIITAPNRSIDILAIPDVGSAATRAFLRREGPRVNGMKCSADGGGGPRPPLYTRSSSSTPKRANIFPFQWSISKKLIPSPSGRLGWGKWPVKPIGPFMGT